jgi:hypothetical protein
MSAQRRERRDAMCGNCDRPARRLVPLVRFSARGQRIDLLVCWFCQLQLSPGVKDRRLPR